MGLAVLSRGFLVVVALGMGGCCHKEPVFIPCPEPPEIVSVELPCDAMPSPVDAKRQDQALRASIVLLKAEVRRRDLLLDAYRVKKKPVSEDKAGIQK